MSAMVSFLVVAQTSNSIHRYMDARRLLSDLMRASRELLQHTVSFSRYKVYGEKAKKWREQIANQTVALLNSVSHVLTTSVEWRIKKNYSTIIIKGLSSEKEHLALSYVNGRCDRIPFVHLVKLREIIASHGQALSSPLEAVQELVLLKFTANISEAYHFLLQLVMTRYPFPLVQVISHSIQFIFFVSSFFLLRTTHHILILYYSPHTKDDQDISVRLDIHLTFCIARRCKITCTPSYYCLFLYLW